MILNDKYLSLPPFISTSWDKVLSLRFDGEALHIDLTNGQSVNIPSPALPPEIIEMIFKAHAAHLSKSESQENLMGVEGLKFQVASDKVGDSIKLGINPFEGMNGTLQHNLEMANAPDLPKELVNRITTITKIVAGEEIKNFPKGEPHCNCFYCQIARSLHNQNVDEEIVDEISTKVIPEEIVSDQELEFQQWQIQPSGNQLFTVTNKLDTNEQYNVYLGDPVGCTCGKQGCEHVIAVLKS